MALAIGVDIGGTNTRLGVVDSTGRVVERRRFATNAAAGPGPALERLAEKIAGLRRGRAVAAVGVGVAGLIDHRYGIVRVPPNLPGWHGTEVARELNERTGLPVRVTNDANAVTLGEWRHGAGEGCQDLFCLTLGTGVGGGAIVGGRLMTGRNGAAGELGHTVIFGNGLPCRCGGRGCLERYVGAAYVVKRARERVKAQVKRLTDHRDQLPMFDGVRADKPSLLLDICGPRLRGLTVKEIGQAARRRDPLALELVVEVGHYVGLGLVNVVALLDPERVVVGGGVAGLGAPLLKAIQRTVFRRCQLFDGRRLEVVFAKLGDDAGVVGAARWAEQPAESD
ncbi:MAG TPA: ROK family protein [candidate division WOR-3 bacterium]|uniref:ROK family protein n=1 Tax=candidate division WOR-3 bacterium TaxID=2052148 RepID=A0A7V0XE76_UNCW3|nr:ROK family protein [candidate division WOR-3 bacterium]